MTKFTFYEEYTLYEVTVEDLDETESVYVIAADDFDEAVAASREFFVDRMPNFHLTITGVKELRSPVLTFAVGETAQPDLTE